MAGEGWSVLIGPQGGAFSDYTSYQDIEFLDTLYDFGVATVLLNGLDGLAAPTPDNIIKLVWDFGLATEQTHWQGYLTQVQTKQEGNMYVLRAFTLDAKLHTSQTGSYRNYLGLTPYGIAQAAGTPNPLMVNSQGTTVLTYGIGAPANLVNGANPGVALTQFVADSANLFTNIRRLCLQSRYSGASYGLEWTTQLEGAPASNPFFYLVRRRESRVGYTPEVFNIPEDLTNVRRGEDPFPGLEAVKVIGGGDGDSRITSALAGAGARELVVQDKAIFNTTNADNMANRVLDIHDNSIEIVVAHCYRHASPTRAGDTVTVTQTGRADAALRVMSRHYSLSGKGFTMVFGRPLPQGRDHLQALTGRSLADTTTPQYTDIKPEDIWSSTGDVKINANANYTIVPAFGAAVLLDTAVDQVVGSLTDLGFGEALYVQIGLFVQAQTRADDDGHSITYDKTTSVTIGNSDSGNAGADPHTHTATPNHTSTAAGGIINPPLLAGPYFVEVVFMFPNGSQTSVYKRVFPMLRAFGVGFAGEYFDDHTYPFAVSDGAGSYTPNRIQVLMRNDGDFNITFFSRFTGVGTYVRINRNDLHRHNEF